MASLVLLEFGVMGIPYHAAAQQNAADGTRHGYGLGFAAGATGADRSWVIDNLDVYRHTGPGDDMVQQAYRDAFSTSLWQGQRAGAALSLEAKATDVERILEVAVENHVSFDGTGSEYARLVHGIARVAELETQSQLPGFALPEDGSRVPTDSGPDQRTPTDSGPDHRVPTDSGPDHRVPTDSGPPHDAAETSGPPHDATKLALSPMLTPPTR